MNWQNDPDLLAAEENLPKECNLTLKHARQSNLKKTEENLFGAGEFVTAASTYNIIQPGMNVGNSLLATQDPGLLAFRNKSIKNTRPHVISPVSQRKVRGVKLQTTLVKTKTRSSLREPIPPLSSLATSQSTIKSNKSEPQEEDDDMVAYFSKHKDGYGLQFIYLVYAQNPKDFDFSPYNLRKVDAKDIGNNYFIMSVTGVTHVDPTGMTESVSLDQWAREESIYQSVRRLKLFKQYPFWYPFTIWKKFVRRQRYEEIRSDVKNMPTFRNPLLFESELKFYTAMDSVKDMISNNLLSVIIHSQMTLDQFEYNCKKMKDELKRMFIHFISNTSSKIDKDIYSKISDKSLTEVHDADFWKGRKKGPNLIQILNLEKKKSELRKEKTTIVNQEIMALGGLIRSVDFMILEAELESSMEAFKKADEIISSDLSAVFKLDVVFNDEGTIELVPGLQQIENAISSQFLDSIKLLNSLPRLLHDIDMRPFIRDSGTDVNAIFRYGPTLSLLFLTRKEHQVSESHILEVIRESYKEAIEATQSFSEFYEVYQYGKSWNVNDFLHAKNGQKYTGEISISLRPGQPEDAFLINNGDEPTVDFEVVKNALAKYTNDKKRISNIRQKNYKGALYIDSSELTAQLEPIPRKALKELKELILSLAVMKNNLIENVLKSYSVSFKSEPKLLDAYISLCALLKKADKLVPTIKEEITFVNEASKLLEEYGQQLPVLNTLEKLFAQFQADQETAKENRKSNYDIFAGELTKKAEDMQSKLSELYQDLVNIPTTLESIECDLQEFFKKTNRLKGIAMSYEDSIKKLIEEQNITEIHINNFEFYQVVLNTIDANLLIFQAVKEWGQISEFVNNDPFDVVDMKKFNETLDIVSRNIEELQKLNIQSPIVNQLKERIDTLNPVLDNINELSKAPLKQRHWETLYSLCDVAEKYEPTVVINTLLRLGILIQTDIISNMTSTVAAEAEIETQYFKISEEWNNTNLKVVETAILSEETLSLAPIGPTLANIDDALISLNRIISVPYSMSIRDKAIELVGKLQSSEEILEAWSLFQENFEVLSKVFKNEETKNMLPKQTETYSEVLQQWQLIAKHTIKDRRLFSVCSYPDLCNIFRSMEKTLERVNSEITPLLDKKRVISPRLNFISDIELLDLITTKSFSKFTSIVSKIFMGISRIDVHDSDHSGYDNMHRFKFYGLTGTTGESLPFMHPINYVFETEVLTNDLIEAMQDSIKEQISMSLINFSTISFGEWASSVTTYVAETVLNIIATREITECIKKIEINPNECNILLSVYQRRINDILSLRRPGITNKERAKISALIIYLSSVRDRIAKLVKPRPNYQPEFALSSSMLKYSFSGSTNDVMIEMGATKWNFGYEFWGDPPSMIFTPEIEESYQDVATAGTLFGPTMIIGETQIGKALLARTLAASYGCPAFIFNAFPETNINILRRIIVGTAATGSWTIMADVDKLTSENLSYIFDVSWEINSLNNTGNIYIEGTAHELSKTSRIFFTTAKPQKLSPQMRKFARMVGMRTPNLEKIAEIKLAATGFHDYAELAPKILEFITSVKELFGMHSLIHEINLIVEKAITLKRTSSEESQIASACFDIYESQCNDDVLTHLVYAAFPTGSTFDELVQKINYARFDEYKENLKRLVLKEVSRLNVKVPIDVFTNNIVKIKTLLKAHMCVIVVGPPCTGKTLMIKILEKVMQRQEYKEMCPDELPLQIIQCFMGADLPENVYGYTKNGRFNHGQIISMVQEKYKQHKNHNLLLKFDGPITREFDNFMTSFLGTPDLTKLTLGSSDSFDKAHSPRIIIETSDISQISPALISRSAIVMTSGATEKHCIMASPNYTLSHASSVIGDFTNDTIMKVLEVFQKVAPSIVSDVYNRKNPICFIRDASYSTDDIRVITESLPVYSATLALQQFMFNKNLLESDYGITLAFIYSFFQAFAGIFTRSEQEKFESWLINHYMIKMGEWPDYVSKDFVKTFPHPSLESCIIEFDKLRPIVSTKTTGDKNVPYILYPLLNNTVQCLQAKINVLVYCTNGILRKKFIDILLKENEWIKPIRVNGLKKMSATDLALFIYKHTQYNIKDENYNNQYILIVENLTKRNMQIIEFIRMFMSEQKFRLHSPFDPKYSEYITLPNIRVIVTTTSIEGFPSRFISRFVPVRIDEFSIEQLKEMTAKKLYDTGLSQSKVDWICNFTSEVIDNFSKDSNEPILMDTINSITNITEKYNATIFTKAIMAEINMRVLFNLDPSEYKEKIIEISQKTVPGAIERKAISDFLNYRTLCVCHQTGNGDEIKLTETRYETVMEDMQKAIEDLKKKKIDIGLLRIYPTMMYCYNYIKRYIEMHRQRILYLGNNTQEKCMIAKFFAYRNGINFVHIINSTDLEYTIVHMKKAISDAIDGKKTILFLECAINPEQIKLIDMLCSKFSFIQFCSNAELNEMYQKISNEKYETYDQAYSVYTKLNDMITDSITVILSLPSLGEQNKEDVCIINPPPISEADILFYAKQKIKTTILKSYSEEFSPNLDEIITSVCKNPPANCRGSKELLFIDNFVVFAETHLNRLESHNKMCSNAIKILTEMDEETENLQSRLSTLSPVLNAIQVDSDTMSKNYTTKKEAIESRTEVLTKELNKKKGELDEIVKRVEELLAEYQKYEPLVFEAASAVSELTENDIKTIRLSAEDETPFIKSLFECLCLFLGQEPSYEKNGINLLNNDDIVNIILEKVRPFSLGPYEQGILDKYFEQPEFKNENFDLIAPGFKSFFDIIESVEKITKVRNVLIVESEKLETKQEEYDTKEEATNSELSSLQSVGESLVTENEELQKLLKQREEYEKTHKEITDRLAILNRLADNLGLLRKTWNDDINDKFKKQRVVTSCLLFAYSFIFCLSVEDKERTNLYNKAKEIIDPLNSIDCDIATFFENALSQRYPEYYKGRFDCISDSSISTILSLLQLVKNSIAVFDRDGFVLSALEKLENVKVVSQSVSNIDDVIKKALINGTLLVISDFSRITPLIVELTNQPACFSKPMEIFFNGEVIKCHENARVVFISAKHPSELSSNIRNRIITINNNSERSPVSKDFFYSQFFTYLRKDSQQNLIDALAAERTRKANLALYKIKALEIINKDAKGGFLQDQEKIEEFCEAKNGYFIGIGENNEMPELSQYLEDIQPFESHVDLVCMIWSIISRSLTKINTDVIFNINHYGKYITNCLSRDGLMQSPTEKQLIKLKKSLLVASLQMIFFSLPLNDAYAIAFRIAIAIKQKSPSEQEIETISDHFALISTRMNEKIEYESRKIPDKIETTFMSTVRTSDVILALSKFISNNTVENFDTFIPPFQIEQCISPTSTIPTIIFASKYADPTPIVHMYLMQRVRLDSLVVVSLNKSPDSIRIAERLLNATIKVSSTAIIHYADPNQAAGDLLSDIFFKVRGGQADPNFRMIIICHSSKHLSQTLILEARKINYEDPFMLRQYMQQMFAKYSSAIQSSTNAMQIKKLSYALNLAMALITCRNAIRPGGYLDYISPNVISYYDIVKQIPFVVAASSSNIPMENLYIEIRKILMPSIISTSDRDKVDALIRFVIPPEIFEDDFNIVNKKNSKWSVPGDVTLSTISSMIMGLPNLPSGTPFGMPRAAKIIRNWKLTSWILRPFVRSTKFIFDKNDAYSNLSNMLSLIPEQLHTENIMKYKSAKGLFLLHEITKYNSICDFIRDSIARAIEEIYRNRCVVSPDTECLAKGNVPDSWKKVSGVYSFCNPSTFIARLNDMYTQYMRWNQDAISPVINVSCMSSLIELLVAHKIEYALENKEVLSDLEYVYSLATEKEELGKGELVLCGLTLAFGKIVDGKVALLDENDKSPFTKISGIKVSLKSKKKEANEEETENLLTSHEILLQSVDSFADSRNTNDDLAQQQNGNVAFHISQEACSDFTIFNRSLEVELPATATQEEFYRAGTGFYSLVQEQL